LKTIRENVCYRSVDYAISIEVSSNNIFQRNLITNVVGAGDAENDASGFMIEDMRNLVTDNRVSGSLGSGYMIMTDSSTVYEIAGSSTFTRNLARSIGLNCFEFEKYIPNRAVYFDRLMASKCGLYGIFSSDGLHYFSNSMLSNSWAGTRFEGSGQRLGDSTIIAITNNQPQTVPPVPAAGLFVQTEPRRGIHLIDGPHIYDNITLLHFDENKRACIGPFGNKIASILTSLNNIECQNQTLLYVNTNAKTASDSERFFAVMLTNPDGQFALIKNSPFMILNDNFCSISSIYSAICDQSLYTSISISDVYKSTTQYEPNVNPNDPKAAILRVKPNGTIKAVEHMVGISETMSNKIDQYQTLVPHGDRVSDIYGIVFESHSTPSNMLIQVGPVQDSRLTIALCYYPSKTKIKSLKQNGVLLTRAENQAEFEKTDSKTYFYNSRSGTLLLKIVPTSTSVQFDIAADISYKQPFNCFGNETIDITPDQSVVTSSARSNYNHLHSTCIYFVLWLIVAWLTFVVTVS